MLGIIGGTSLIFSELPSYRRETVATPFGPAEVHILDEPRAALLMRHQYGLPPHRINYTACLAALSIAGVDRVVSIGSSGSLQREIVPGSLLIPDDYVSLAAIPSIHDHRIDHVSPGVDRDLAVALAGIVPGARTGGVYVQTRGPRIETKAEVRALARIADIVGMTVASEATLAHELGMRFAALCTVDNYAHGLADHPLTYEEILRVAHANRERTEKVMKKILETLA